MRTAATQFGARDALCAASPDRNRRWLAPIVAITLLAACAAEPPPRPLPVPVRRVAAPPPEEAAAPAPRTRPVIEESDVGNTSALPTAAEAAAPTPAPAPEQVAAVPNAPVAPVKPVAPSTESESPLSRIGPKTPPNVSAALHQVEDGRQHMNQGHYDQALDRFERAVTIDPTNAYAYYFLAQLHYQMKKYDQAIAFASRAVTLGARSDQSLMARAYSLEGAVYENVGRYSDARTAYQHAVDVDPNNLSARVGMARLSPNEAQP